MQDAGHRPIILIGGGTALIGDPTGKTDMRKMMTKDFITLLYGFNPSKYSIAAIAIRIRVI